MVRFVGIARTEMRRELQGEYGKGRRNCNADLIAKTEW